MPSGAWEREEVGLGTVGRNLPTRSMSGKEGGTASACFVEDHREQQTSAATAVATAAILGRDQEVRKRGAMNFVALESYCLCESTPTLRHFFSDDPLLLVLFPQLVLHALT